MFKKSIAMAAAALLVVLLFSCQAKYADLNEVLGKMIAATETLIAGMDKAADAPGVAGAVTAYTTSLKELSGKFRDLMKKYPELQGKDKDGKPLKDKDGKELPPPKEPPQELKANVDKLNAMSEKLMMAMAKLQTYADDPAVRDAVQKMTELQME